MRSRTCSSVFLTMSLGKKSKVSTAIANFCDVDFSVSKSGQLFVPLAPSHSECWFCLFLRSQPSSITHSCLFLHPVVCQPKPEAQPPRFSSPEQRLATLANYLHCPKGNWGKKKKKNHLWKQTDFACCHQKGYFLLVSEGFGGSILVHGKID